MEANFSVTNTKLINVFSSLYYDPDFVAEESNSKFVKIRFGGYPEFEPLSELVRSKKAELITDIVRQFTPHALKDMQESFMYKGRCEAIDNPDAVFGDLSKQSFMNPKEYLRTATFFGPSVNREIKLGLTFSDLSNTQNSEPLHSEGTEDIRQNEDPAEAIPALRLNTTPNVEINNAEGELHSDVFATDAEALSDEDEEKKLNFFMMNDDV